MSYCILQGNPHDAEVDFADDTQVANTREAAGKPPAESLDSSRSAVTVQPHKSHRIPEIVEVDSIDRQKCSEGYSYRHGILCGAP